MRRLPWLLLLCIAAFPAEGTSPPLRQPGAHIADENLRFWALNLDLMYYCNTVLGGLTENRNYYYEWDDVAGMEKLADMLTALRSLDAALRDNLRLKRPQGRYATPSGDIVLPGRIPLYPRR